MPSPLDVVFGSKPRVPTVPQLNLGTEAGKAIRANITNLPAAEQLVGKANLFSRQQIDQMLGAVIPDYKAIGEAASTNIESWLKGEIPADVSAAVQNAGAARALGLGTAGGGMERNLVARDLGLTSLDLMGKGLSSAESWMGTMANIYEPQMMNVSSMFVTPAQMAAFDVEERNTQVQREWLQNQIKAMPDPGWRGVHDTAMSIFTAYLGGSYGGDMNWSKSMGNLNSSPTGGGGYTMPSSPGPGNYESMYGGGGGGGWWGGTSGGSEADYATFLGGMGGGMGGP